MANRETSPELSSLAARIMGEAKSEDPAYNTLLVDAKRLAGSVLSQDETPGQDKRPTKSGNEYQISTRLREFASELRVLARKPVAGKFAKPLEDMAANLNEVIDELEKPIEGTHAYELIAQMERANVDTTETLIYMIAATVLSKLIEDEGGGRSNVSFSPKDMDAMYRDYNMSAKREGLLTTVSISPRDPAKHARHDIIGGMRVDYDPGLMTQDEDTTDAKPQAEAKPHDRPIWAVRYYAARNMDGLEPYLAKCHDKADAERQLITYQVAGDKVGDGRPDPVIENRFCLHIGCPTNECLEVTSG